MQYDPIKKFLGNIFNKTPFLRVLFYKLLDLLLLRTWHIKKEIHSIKKQIPQNARVLDAGSGFGQYTHYLATRSKNWSIKGVDVKAEQIADCNKFFDKIGLGSRVKFEEADLTKFSEPDTYDLILSVDVMEHILNDVAVFRNFYASMAAGGVLVLSTPSDMGGSDVHDDNKNSFIDEHVRDGYNMDEIKDKLIGAGFSKVEVRYSYGCPGRISWRLSMKYPIKIANWNKIFLLILPCYYIMVYPFAYVLNFIDTHTAHKEGTGLIVKAWK